jgi:hypothetical protein
VSLACGSPDLILEQPSVRGAGTMSTRFGDWIEKIG